MKTYFDFIADPKKFIPLWIIYYAIILAYIFLMPDFYADNVTQFNSGTEYSVMLYISALVFIAFFICTSCLAYFIYIWFIEGVSYNGSSIKFKGSFWSFFGKILSGFVISILTLGLYLPWFVSSVYSLFVDRSSIDGYPFYFRGNGGKLFVIFALSLFAPMIVLGVGVNEYFPNLSTLKYYMVGYQILVLLILIPFFFLTYKWMVNISYKEYKIELDAKFWNASIVIFREFILSIVTLGLYIPMAYLKIYAFFVKSGVANKGDIHKRFGFELNPMEDFLYFWKQILFTVVTVGLYYPWAVTKVLKRVLQKTYLD